MRPSIPVAERQSFVTRLFEVMRGLPPCVADAASCRTRAVAPQYHGKRT